MKNKPHRTLTLGLLIFLITSIGHAEVSVSTATRQNNSRLTILIEPSSINRFMGTNWWKNKDFWYGTSTDNILFGKRVIDWNESDFQLLEQKLKEQIDLERIKAIEFNKVVAASSRQSEVQPPERDSTYMLRKQLLEEIISSIPQFKLWTAAGRENEQALIEQRAKETKHQEEELLLAQHQYEQSIIEQNTKEKKMLLLRQQEEENRKIEDEAREQQQDKQLLKTRIIFLFFIITAVPTAGWVYYKFLTKRCSSCKSMKLEEIVNRRREIDRWVGTNTITVGSGDNRRQENVTATWVKVECYWRCKECNHEWCEIKQWTL